MENGKTHLVQWHELIRPQLRIFPEQYMVISQRSMSVSAISNEIKAISETDLIYLHQLSFSVHRSPAPVNHAESQHFDSMFSRTNRRVKR